MYRRLFDKVALLADELRHTQRIEFLLTEYLVDLISCQEAVHDVRLDIRNVLFLHKK